MLQQPLVPAPGWWGRGLWRRCRAVLRLCSMTAYLLWVALQMSTVFSRQPIQRRDALVKHWSGQILWRLGVRRVVVGKLHPQAALYVSNHVSWLDIMAINSVRTCTFVSKKEVSAWPLVGGMVTRAGTLYVDRSKRRDAQRVLHQMVDTLREGHAVAVFPEGTTGAGERLLPFHSNLLQSAIEAHAPIQPLLLRYLDTDHDFSHAAAYVGDTTLIQSLWWVACADQMTVQVHVLPRRAAPHPDRRALAHSLCQEIGHVLAGFVK